MSEALSLPISTETDTALSTLTPYNTIDSYNSTSTALTSGSTFTGTGVDISKYPSLTINIESSHPGVLYIDFSSDGKNWDITSNYSYSTSSDFSKRVAVIAKYYRVRFLNNSGSNQTFLRLQSIAGTQEIESSVSIDTTGLAKSGTVSSYNSTSTLLTNGSTFTGVGEDVSSYSSVTVACKTDQNGLLYIDFSPDNTNWDSTLTFTIDANINEVHRITITRQYYRMRIYNNSGSDQTFLRATSMYGDQITLTSVTDSNIQSDADSILCRSIITGQKPNTKFSNVKVDAYGHLETVVHGPLLPFGSMHVENILPLFQFDAVYSINPTMLVDSSNGSGLGGTATVSNSSFVCNTTTNVYGNATLQSKKRIRYRPGQGTIIRFTAKYTSGGANNTYQVVGMGHAEDGYYFGYKNTDFGILYINRNLREIASLTVSTGATSSGNVTITLGGTAYTVAVTNSSNVNRTAWEISQHAYDGWNAEQRGATVYFIAGSSGVKTNTYTFGAGTTGSAVSSIARVRAGDKTTYPETFIAQSSWNFDVMDGSNSSDNPSGITLDPSKYNVYQIQMQYLGAGTMVFSLMSAQTDNNPIWTPVHIITNPNTLTQSHVGNPSFPFTMSAYKLNSATDLTVSCASVMGGIEGKSIKHGPRITYRNINNLIGTTLTSIFSVKNTIYYKGIPNQSVIHIRSLSAAARGGNNVLTTIYIIRNATLTGNPNFGLYDTNASCSLYDNTAGITVSTTSNSQLLFSFSIGETGQIVEKFDSDQEEFDIQPGDYITVAAQTNQSTSYVIVSLNTREDQ